MVSLFLVNIKQLLDEVFVICGIINVEVRVIRRTEGEADNSYQDIDNLSKKMLLPCQPSMPTNTTYCNNLHRSLNMQITQLSASR